MGLGLEDDEEGTSWGGGSGMAAGVTARKRKELAASTAALRMRRSEGPALSSDAYQQRLLGVSSSSCAWSPVVTAAVSSPQQQQQAAAEGAGQRCCFLAVGAKAGRIWLWRYRLPQQYSPVPPQGDAGAFQLVGCLAGSPAAWVSSLEWQLLPGGSLVLAAGCSDGSVLLYGAEGQQLAGLPPRQQQLQQQEDTSALPPVMQRWCMACQPDQMAVTSLSLQLHRSSGGGGGAARLLVAAGKAAGSLAVWRSGELSSSRGSTEQAKALRGIGSASVVAAGLMGTRPLTGLAWLPPQQQQEQQPLLVACSQEGAVACWRLAAAAAGSGSSRLELRPASGGAQACGRRKKSQQGHCALGLAVSPGGLFLAVVRLSLSPTAEILR